MALDRVISICRQPKCYSLRYMVSSLEGVVALQLRQLLLIFIFLNHCLMGYKSIFCQSSLHGVHSRKLIVETHLAQEP
jgi:hypothetical protein